MDTDINKYRIHYLLRNYIEKIKYRYVDADGDNASWSSSISGQLQSSDGKKNQMIDQLIYEARIHFTTYMSGENEHDTAGDILRVISEENGRRESHATLIQDSRRR